MQQFRIACSRRLSRSGSRVHYPTRFARAAGILSISAISIAYCKLQSHPVTISHCSSASETAVPELSNCPHRSETAINLLEKLINALRFWLDACIEGIRIAQRSVYLACIFTPSLLSSPVLLLGNSQFFLVKWWWELFRDAIRLSGPCNIKFSQWIATRPDLFPLIVCQQLQDLQTNAIRCGWPETLRTLVAMFGDRWEEVLSLDKDPLTGAPKIVGSGCVAQVFRGTLLQEPYRGTAVAIKVIHPHVAKSIADDIRIMRLLTCCLEWVPALKNMGLVESVEEFAMFINSQLDLTREAASLSRFRKNFGNVSSLPFMDSSSAQTATASSSTPSTTQKITFPEPVYPLVTKQALVETFMEGELMLDLIGSVDAPTRRALATMGLDAILKMVFQDNFIHADMHMGNIICERKPTGEYAMAMIDAGLVAELEPHDRKNFIDLFKAVVLNDGKRVGRLIIERSKNYGECIDPEQFESDLQDVVSAVHAAGLSLGRIGIGALLQRVLVACYNHNVKLENKFVSVVLAIGVVEGLGRRLDPDVDILRKAAPYVIKASIDMRRP